jgi:hypothetical protein
VGYKRYVTNSVTILSQSVSSADAEITQQLQTDIDLLSSSFSSSLINLSSSFTSSLSSLSSSFSSSLSSLSSSFSSSLGSVNLVGQNYVKLYKPAPPWATYVGSGGTYYFPTQKNGDSSTWDGSWTSVQAIKCNFITQIDCNGGPATHLSNFKFEVATSGYPLFRAPWVAPNATAVATFENGQKIKVALEFEVARVYSSGDRWWLMNANIKTTHPVTGTALNEPFAYFFSCNDITSDVPVTSGSGMDISIESAAGNTLYIYPYVNAAWYAI